MGCDAQTAIAGDVIASTALPAVFGRNARSMFFGLV